MKYTKYLDSDKKHYSVFGFLATTLYAIGVPQFLGAVLCATRNFLF